MKHLLVGGLLCLSVWPAGFARADPEPKDGTTAARVRALIAQTESEYPEARLRGVRALGRMGAAAREAVSALGLALGDLDKDVRKAAGRALAQIGAPAIPLLLEELKRPRPQDVTRAAFSLALIGPDAAAAVPALSGLLKDKDAEVRAMAAYALGEIGPAAGKAVTTLTVLLDDPSPEVKKRTWGALAGIGRPAIPALRGALKSPQSETRQRAADLLALLGQQAKQAVEDLIALLEDKQPPVRRSAALALGAVGKDAQDALGALTLLALDKEAQVRAAAAWALCRVRADSAFAVPTLIDLFRDPDSAVRTEAARAVVRIGAPAVEALARAVLHKDLFTRQLAMLCLGEIGPGAGAAVPTLVGQLTDALPGMRSAAAATLGQIGPRSAGGAVKPLQEALRREADVSIRLSLRIALIQLQPEDKEGPAALIEDIVAVNEDLLKKNLAAAVASTPTRPRPIDKRQQARIKGVLDFYVHRNSFRFGDGLDTWSHNVLESLGVEAIPSMVDTLNLENAVGGVEGYVVKGVAVADLPRTTVDSVFFH